MRLGQLRHLIRIEEKVVPRDAITLEFGEPTWQLFAEVYARKSPLSARDPIAAQAAQSEATARFLIRYREGVLPTMRIVYAGEIYSIEGPPLEDEDSGLEHLTILVSKGVKDG